MGRSLFCCAAAVIVVSLPSADAWAELQAHRAAYRLNLASGEASSGVIDASGGLVVEYRRDCDGWESRQRLGFVADTEEGQDFTYDVHSTNWESLDHTKLRFTTVYFQGEMKLEEFRGEASFASGKDAGTADFEVPTLETVRLPAGTEFPTAHVMTLIEAAEAGDLMVTRELFTGSGPDPLMTVNAVIAHPKDVEDTPVKGWRVRLAFFPTDGTSEVPVTEIGYYLGSDGVIDDVIIDYGDFVLEGERASLEWLDHPDCT